MPFWQLLLWKKLGNPLKVHLIIKFLAVSSTSFITHQLCKVADIYRGSWAVWIEDLEVTFSVQDPLIFKWSGPVYLKDCLRIPDGRRCQQTEVSIMLTLVCAENRAFSTWLVAEQEQTAEGKKSCQLYYLLLHLNACLWHCLLLSPVCEKSPQQKQQDDHKQHEPYSQSCWLACKWQELSTAALREVSSENFSIRVVSQE